MICILKLREFCYICRMLKYHYDILKNVQITKKSYHD